VVEDGYVRRLPDAFLEELLGVVPAVMVTGPRAAGKTTTARRLAADVLRLDDPAVAAVVAADPDAALRRAAEPVLIDEWQEVPQVLGAVKRAVDDDPRPGRFVLTGSVEADLTSTMWPGTGRVVRVVLHGLTRREIAGTVSGTVVGGVEAPGLWPAVVAGDLGAVAVPANPVDLDGYVRLALVGGFPEPALRLPDRVRAAWFDSYLEHVVTRDVAAAGQRRDPVRLRRYLETLAASTAGLPTDLTLFQAAGIDKRTAEAYDRLLATLYLLDLVPAWASNRIARLVKRSKRYLVDPALAMSAARLDATAALSDPDLLGRLLDTFVAAQLRPEIHLLQPRARLHHLRTEAGRQEIDLVVDLGAGRLVGIEVKAASAPTRRDARHLVWLRDQVGAGFVRGVIFHTGPQPFELDERIWALPIATLWA
jgi:predicted AAA+ superfamily ATPase